MFWTTVPITSTAEWPHYTRPLDSALLIPSQFESVIQGDILYSSMEERVGCHVDFTFLDDLRNTDIILIVANKRNQLKKIESFRVRPHPS
jgi:hypothetical protein